MPDNGTPTRREDRNAAALHRLHGGKSSRLPSAVLVHAEAQRFVPHLPRLAVESYWRSHPVRSDRLARALAARSTPPEGWMWRNTAAKFNRMPPTPFRDSDSGTAPGQCCICGQPVYRLGWHIDLWDDGRLNVRAGWHACCVAAWKLWVAPSDQASMLRRLQGRKCPRTGQRLLKTAEVDHRVPLFRVWRDYRDLDWPDLLSFWGMPNLQAINRAAHVEKCASEAGDRVRPELRT